MPTRKIWGFRGGFYFPTSCGRGVRILKLLTLRLGCSSGRQHNKNMRNCSPMTWIWFNDNDCKPQWEPELVQVSMSIPKRYFMTWPSRFSLKCICFFEGCSNSRTVTSQFSKSNMLHNKFSASSHNIFWNQDRPPWRSTTSDLCFLSALPSLPLHTPHFLCGRPVIPNTKASFSPALFS